MVICKVEELKMKAIIIGTLAMATFFSGIASASQKKIKIGFSMDTLKEERWQRDKELFVKRAQELGAEVLVQAAEGNATLQNNQAENLLTQGVDVLVVVPNNAITTAAIVEAAHKARKKVLSYERLIRNSDVDLYIASDAVEIGREQAAYLTKHVPKGNYVLIGGAPTDNNAKLLRDGQMQILKPFVDRGDIKIVADQWAKDWQASEALKHTENALTKHHNNIQAILVSNDGTAGGVISALKQQKLEGKIAVSGQDADLVACQRIVEGSQTMTIYRSIYSEATQAAEAAVALAKNEKVATAKDAVANGKINVPAILIKPVQVDKNNMMATVIKEGFHKKEDVYKNIPKELWPK